MLSLNFIRSHAELVRQAIAKKNISLDLDRLLKLDVELRNSRAKLEAMRQERNQLSDTFAKSSLEERVALSQQSKDIGAMIKVHEAEISPIEHELKNLLLRIPSIPWNKAPVGPDEAANIVIRQVGEPRHFDFEVRDHVDLMEMNDWADLSRIVKVAGPRTYCLKGRLALLEQALLLYTARRLTDLGFTYISVPAMAREQAFVGTGHFPMACEDAYELPKDNLFLAGTAEIALTNLHSNELLDESCLPMLYAGFSSCFRREAGSAGRDVRGLLRVHQFFKIEQYVICRSDSAESAYWHDHLLNIAESILTDLELPYQVIEASTGDMGAGKFRMNDIETWIPSLKKYRETHSCSTLHDWQARRANIRYRPKEGGPLFVHTLNNTAIASPRILVPILENHQTTDGKVRIPSCLRIYFGNDEFL